MSKKIEFASMKIEEVFYEPFQFSVACLDRFLTFLSFFSSVRLDANITNKKM